MTITNTPLESGIWNCVPWDNS